MHTLLLSEVIAPCIDVLHSTGGGTQHTVSETHCSCLVFLQMYSNHGVTSNNVYMAPFSTCINAILQCFLVNIGDPSLMDFIMLINMKTYVRYADIKKQKEIKMNIRTC